MKLIPFIPILGIIIIGYSCFKREDMIDYNNSLIFYTSALFQGTRFARFTK